MENVKSNSEWETANAAMMAAEMELMAATTAYDDALVT